MRKKFLAYFFISFIVLFFILNIVIKDKEFSDNENRVLTTMPSFTVEKLLSGKYTRNYEKYVDDQFPFRNFFVALKNESEKTILKKDSNGVYFVNDGSLIQKENIDIIDSQLNKNIQALEKFCIENQNVSVMIVPTANEILKDKLPAYAKNSNEKEIIEYIETKTNDTFVNVYDVLEKNKDNYVYYKTDHHWTTYGALLAFNEFLKTKQENIDTNNYKLVNISYDFLGSLHSKVNLMNIEEDEISIRDLGGMHYEVNYNDEEVGKENETTIYDLEKIDVKDKYQVFLGGNYPLINIKNTDVKNNKKIVVIKDSYANCFIPFLIDKYESIDIVDLRMYNASVKEYLTGIKSDYEVLILYSLSNFDKDVNVYKLNK